MDRSVDSVDGIRITGSDRPCSWIVKLDAIKGNNCKFEVLAAIDNA